MRWSIVYLVTNLYMYWFLVSTGADFRCVRLLVLDSLTDLHHEIGDQERVALLYAHLPDRECMPDHHSPMSRSLLTMVSHASGHVVRERLAFSVDVKLYCLLYLKLHDNTGFSHSEGNRKIHLPMPYQSVDKQS